MKVYLAGGMKGDWQDRLMSLAPSHEYFDPRNSGITNPTPTEYTEWDLGHVDKADVVVVYMASDNPSGFGCSVELGYAYGKKPIIFIDRIADDWRSRYFDMHRVMALEVVDGLESAADALDLLGEIDGGRVSGGGA